MHYLESSSDSDEDDLPVERAALLPLRSDFSQRVPPRFVAVVNGATPKSSARLSKLPQVEITLLREIVPRLAPSALSDPLEMLQPLHREPCSLTDNPRPSVDERQRIPTGHPTPEITPAAYQQFQQLFPSGIRISCSSTINHDVLQRIQQQVFRHECHHAPETGGIMRRIIAERMERARIWDNLTGAGDLLSDSASQNHMEQEFVTTLNDLLQPELLRAEALPQVVQDSLPIKVDFVSSCSNTTCCETRSR